MRLTSYFTRGLTAVTLGFVVSSAFAADLTPAPVNDNLNAVLWDQTPSSSRRTRLAHMRSERSGWTRCWRGDVMSGWRPFGNVILNDV